MTPLLEQKIEAVLETVQKPSRYIGGEANQVRKPQATTVVALCYPDAYEIGISNQALQILYRQVNARPAMAAERVYCPWPDLAGIPLRAADRGEGDPIVVAGGPSASNPAPLAPFFDAFFMGESEEAFE